MEFSYSILFSEKDRIANFINYQFFYFISIRILLTLILGGLYFLKIREDFLSFFDISLTQQLQYN